MANISKKINYVPGTYAGQGPNAVQLAEEHIQDWLKRMPKIRAPRIEPLRIRPAICFSRKIGVGALEIADLLAEKLNYRVADRVLLDYIARNKKLGKQTIEFFDERYPGKIAELAALLFGEKSFIMSDYIRNFISAAYVYAAAGSTIFVGRGVHLFFPRDRVLAVRIICSDHQRVIRLGKILNLEEKNARRILNKFDKEQREFFKKAYGKNEASPYEFDLVINCDFIRKPQSAVEIIARAFHEKFSEELARKQPARRKAS